jgi:hypothetical protein
MLEASIKSLLGVRVKTLLGGAVLAAMAIACSSQVADEEDLAQVGTKEQALAVRGKNLWAPAGTSVKTLVPMCFLNGTDEQRQNVRNIVENGWEAIDDEAGDSRYGVDFTGWATCPSDPKGRFISIKFNPDLEAGGVVHGGLGRGALNENPSMELRSASQRTILHEFGHALSFSHEFIRPDFDPPEDCTATNGTDPDVGISAPDTQSIMNYVSCGLDSTDLSGEDVVAFQRLYGPFSLSYSNRGQVNPLALRNRFTRFVRPLTTSGGDILAASGDGIPANAHLHLVKADAPTSTALVRFGDRVRILTDSGYLYSDATATSVAQAVKVKTAIDSKSVFRIAGGTTGEEVGVSDPIDFIHVASGKHMVAVGSRLQILDAAQGSWTFISLGVGAAF